MATPTPASILKNARQDAGYKRDIERARAEGRMEGRSEARKEILDWLQKEYMQPGAPERGSVEAKALLKVAKDFAEWSRKQGEPRKQEKK